MRMPFPGGEVSGIVFHEYPFVIARGWMLILPDRLAASGPVSHCCHGSCDLHVYPCMLPLVLSAWCFWVFAILLCGGLIRYRLYFPDSLSGKHIPFPQVCGPSVLPFGSALSRPSALPFPGFLAISMPSRCEQLLSLRLPRCQVCGPVTL